MDRAITRPEALEVDIGRIAGVFDDDVHQHAVGLTVELTTWIDVLLRAVEVTDASPRKGHAALRRVAPLLR